MIIGTAGHVDHGKSSLVTALTGRSMDRLAEERQRGITIELGFTGLDLGEGQRVSVVDVPGHEDFIRSMVAGASGMDAAMLVVAADDGIMPQTREHLAVMEQLGVPLILPLVTKVDLVDPERLAVVMGEVDQWLRSSPLESLPPLAVSSRDRRGLKEVRSALIGIANRNRSQEPDDLFRMPVDRAFIVTGSGVVVTGTTWSGTVREGDEVEVHPGRVLARVRRIETHGEAVAAALPGSRTALALAGLELEDIRRGSVLIQAGMGWLPTARLIARISLDRDATAPVRLRELRLSLGTADVAAHASTNEEPLRPGEQRVVALRLDREVIARGGDRFVMRQPSSGRVIGGGLVLDPLPPARGATRRSAEPTLANLAQVRRWGITAAEAAVAGGVVPRVAAESLEREGLLSLDGHWFGPRRVQELEDSLVTWLAEWHATSPLERGMPVATLLARLGAAGGIGRALLERLVSQGRVAVGEGTGRLASFTPQQAGGPELDRLLAEVRRDGLQPRPASELPGEASTRDRLLRELVTRRLVVPLEKDRFVSAEALAGFRQVLERCGAAGPITPAVVREASGLSRKHLIPLLEWADRAGVTIRRGDARTLLVQPA